jgi:SAM-dependent methyltransferase
MTKTKTQSKISRQLLAIRRAYDQTVLNFQNGISDLHLLPEEFKNSSKFKEFQKIKHACHSGNPQIKKFLNPKIGMKFLDIGSCANLINHKLYRWPSSYYGIDISEKLINTTKEFISRNRIKIGGLKVADVANIPFKNNFFDITSIIGVLEYFNITYIQRALKEIHRVVKPDGKIALDMPNLKHPHIQTMIKMESLLGRPRLALPSREQFEKRLSELFIIACVDDSSLMITYFLKNKK